MASEDESIDKMEDNDHRLRRQQRPDRGDSCVVKQPKEDAIYDELERGSSKDYQKTSKKSSVSKEPELHPHTWASSEVFCGLTNEEVKSNKGTTLGWNDKESLKPTPMSGHVRYVKSDEITCTGHAIDFDSVKHPSVSDKSTSGTVFGWNDEEPLPPTPMRGHVRYIRSNDTSTSATHVPMDQSPSGTVFRWNDEEPLPPTPMTGSVRNEQPSSTEGSLDDEWQERLVTEPISIPPLCFEDQIIDDGIYRGILDGNLNELKDFQTVPSSGIPGYTSSISGSSLDKDNSSADERKAVHKDKRRFTDFINPSLDAELSNTVIVNKSDSLDIDETNDVSCNASFSLEHDPEKDKLLESFSRTDINVGSVDVTKSIDVTISDSPTFMFVEEQSPKEVDDDDKSNGSDIVAVVERKSESLDEDKGDQMDAPNNKEPQATNETSPDSKEYSDFGSNDSVSSLPQDSGSLSTNDYHKTLTSSSQNEGKPSKVEVGSVFAWIQSSFLNGDITYSDFRQMVLQFKQFLIQHERLVETSTALELPEDPGTALAGLDMSELMTYNHVHFMEFFQSYQEIMFPKEKKEVPKKYMYNKTYAEWYSEKVKRIARQKAAEKARKEKDERERLAKQKLAEEDTRRSYDAWKQNKYIAHMERCRIEKEKVAVEQENKIASMEFNAKVADTWRKGKNVELREKRRAARLEEEREREIAADEKEYKRMQNQISFDLWKARTKFAAKPPRGEIPTSSKGLSQAKSSRKVKKPWVGPLDTDEGGTDNPKPGPSRYQL